MSSSDRPATAAAVVAAFMIGQQVAGKAARDALFLSTFDIEALPTMLIASALLSMVAVLVAGKLMARYTPGRVVPATFAGSACALVAEWAVARSAPRVAAVLFYLHIAVFGAILISGFWSIVTERFDPRSAKKRIGRIAGGGALGGVLGGAIAERVGTQVDVVTVLLVLAAMNVVCGAGVGWLRPSESGEPRTQPSTRSGLRVLAETPYLKNLATLVLLATVSAALIDYVLKATAVTEFGTEAKLVRFFAAFHTGVGLFTFAVQSAASRPTLEKWGLAGTAASLPGAVALGGVVSLLVPGLANVAALRGLEAVLRSSLFRSAYELFYNPVPATDKRASKTIIDVGFDRLGDALGGGIVRLVLVAAPLAAERLLMGMAVCASALAVLVARRLGRGYVDALEKSLLDRAVELGSDDAFDKTTKTTFLSLAGRLTDWQRSAAPRAVTGEAVPSHAVEDEVAVRVEQLRSGEAVRIRQALSRPLTPELAIHALPLLGNDRLASTVHRALRPMTPACAGTFIDALLAPGQSDAVRRRVARLLGGCDRPHAVAGLLAGLEDDRFEVRFECGRSLARSAARHGARIDSADVFRAVEREVAVGRDVWESNRRVQGLDDGDESPLVADFLRNRASRSLEHVFTLLSLVLPREPLFLAFRGLHTDDRNLRGTALEYLDTVLPDRIKRSLWPFLEDDEGPPQSVRAPDEVVAELMRCQETIRMNLEARGKNRPPT